MVFGSNLQYLRKVNGGMTQEKLAERMGVSRQTVSKWEAGEAYPEVPKLLELCDVFSCKLDALVRDDLAARHDAYSDVTIKQVKGFRMARYVMVSPNPESDVNTYMAAWAKRSGLLDLPGEHKCIGWDFPFVSQEQRSRFGMHGYAAAYVIPEDFKPECDGAEIAAQGDAQYAVISIRDPFISPFERIPNAYKLILEYLNCNGFKEKPDSDAISCFEYEYEKDGAQYMDVYVLTDGVCKGNMYTQTL